MANLYTVEGLLVGKTYRSKTLTGEIVSATESDVWYGRNAQAYLVEVKPTVGILTKYRTVVVGERDE